MIFTLFQTESALISMLAPSVKRPDLFYIISSVSDKAKPLPAPTRLCRGWCPADVPPQSKRVLPALLKMNQADPKCTSLRGGPSSAGREVTLKLLHQDHKLGGLTARPSRGHSQLRSLGDAGSCVRGGEGDSRRADPARGGLVSRASVPGGGTMDSRGQEPFAQVGKAAALGSGAQPSALPGSAANVTVRAGSRRLPGHALRRRRSREHQEWCALTSLGNPSSGPPSPAGRLPRRDARGRNAAGEGGSPLPRPAHAGRPGAAPCRPSAAPAARRLPALHAHAPEQSGTCVLQGDQAGEVTEMRLGRLLAETCADPCNTRGNFCFFPKRDKVNGDFCRGGGEHFLRFFPLLPEI